MSIGLRVYCTVLFGGHSTAQAAGKLTQMLTLSLTLTLALTSAATKQATNRLSCKSCPPNSIVK